MMQAINMNPKMFLSGGTAEAWQRVCRNEHSQPAPREGAGTKA